MKQFRQKRLKNVSVILMEFHCWFFFSTFYSGIYLRTWKIPPKSESVDLWILEFYWFYSYYPVYDWFWLALVWAPCSNCREASLLLGYNILVHSAPWSFCCESACWPIPDNDWENGKYYAWSNIFVMVKASVEEHVKVNSDRKEWWSKDRSPNNP